MVIKFKKFFLGMIMAFIMISTHQSSLAAQRVIGKDPELPSEFFISQRPKILKEAIETRFNDLQHEQWLYNGKEDYGSFIGLSLKGALKYMVDNNPEQKDFYLMDIGTGDFRWAGKTASTIEKFIEKNHYQEKNLHFYIIGLKGNKSDAEEANTKYLEKKLSTHCTSYLFSQFPIDNMEAEFKKRGLHGRFINNIDFVVSSMTFVHLNDPLGDVVQVCNMLRPSTGIFCLDGLLVGYPKIGIASPPLALSKISGIEYLQDWSGVISRRNTLIHRTASTDPVLPSFSYANTIRHEGPQAPGHWIVSPIFNISGSYSINDDAFSNISGNESLCTEIMKYLDYSTTLAFSKKLKVLREL